MAITPHNDCILDTHTPYGDSKLPLSFVKRRHIEIIEGTKVAAETWRMKERMKTVSVALVLCLNVGVDPPDIVKTQPCARMECWIDPLSMSSQKALEIVGQNLQKQYERWQPRARYKQSLDPTVDEIKKLCTSLRRNAKEERVLFHYNGHGVPKPTVNGEVWVFNRTYTQYIPLSVYDLQTWMGAPSIYVYDCSNAGIIVDMFKQFADQHEKEFEQAASQNQQPSGSAPSFKNCIQLAACSADQILPMNPDLPADIFTSCLTTPIKIALRWFVIQDTSKLASNITLDLIDKIPGQLNDRRTMLGELNWIFTAITDTIAWNMLPRDLFQKLFRQDLLVASLFRNFLLAERIMRSYDCTPVSSPKLPSTYHHPMWQAWDLSLDLCLSQLPTVLEREESYSNSPFFEEQLTAFQMWLERGSDERKPPEQLPIVLQVLLSQVHRLRALELLSRFLDLGPWAVNLALSVGIFPYMLKLLQSSARELRYLLVFIWAKILAVDQSCQADLVRDNGYKYFVQIMQDTVIPSDHRTLAVFAMAVIVKDYLPGQEVALQENLITVCLDQATDSNVLLRLWVVICLARLWQRYDKARWRGVRDSAHEKLYALLNDKEAEVRAAAVYSLGTFMNTETERTEHATNIDQSVATMLVNVVSHDMSPIVRMELVNALQWVVIAFENRFLLSATLDVKANMPTSSQEQIMAVPSVMSTLRRNLSRERIRNTLSPSNACEIDAVSQMEKDLVSARLKRVSSNSSLNSNCSGSSLPMSYSSFHVKVWQCLAYLELDPSPSVAYLAHTLLDYIRDQVRDSTIAKEWIEKSRNCSFLSLPPSPSTKSYFSVDSPPGSAGSSVESYKQSGRLRSLSGRRTMPNMISENASDEERKPLIETKFVDWCSKYFAQFSRPRLKYCDKESTAHFEREWRYARNHLYTEESKEECARAHQFKLENQIFAARSSKPANLILFHPYENYFVVPVKDTFTVWDYANASVKPRQWSVERYPWNRSGHRITAMEFVNAHDNSMLLTGTDNGFARLWSNYSYNSSNREPTLVTGWSALQEMCNLSRNTQSNVRGNFRMAWEQRSQTLFAAGEAKVIRLWDAETEMKLLDVPTGTDAFVNSLSIDPEGEGNLFAAGCSDGSVRVYDWRLPPNSARTITYREHSACIIKCKIRKYSSDLIAGCVNGEITTFDIRSKCSSIISRIPPKMMAFDVHTMADIFACSSSSTNGMAQLTTYDMKGRMTNALRQHDWFAKIPSTVSHVSFHPNRVMLGYALHDCSIVISSLDLKKLRSVTL